MDIKNKIFIQRIIALILVLICILIMVVAFSINKNTTSIEYEHCYVYAYNNSLNRTACEFVIEFNEEVTSANITVDFYNETNEVFDTKTVYLKSLDDNFWSATLSINGTFSNYRIQSYDCDTTKSMAISIVFYVALVLGLIFLCFFFLTLILCCKTYECNGDTILVYAGWVYAYMAINGKKVDISSGLPSNSEKLICNLKDGSLVEADIDAFNRISLKINSIIQIPVEKKKKSKK